MTVTLISSEDAIRARAHALWLEEGKPDGRAEIHWFRAVELLNAEASVPAAKLKRRAASRQRS